MHTVMGISAGLVLLALFCVVGHWLGGDPTRHRAARAFIPVWAVAALVNMTVGVVSAGYTVLQELPITIVVFAVPAVAAMLVVRGARTG